MKALFKLTLAAVVVLALIVPAGLNFWASHQLADVALLAEATRPALEVLDARVTRGLFSSEQTLALRPTDTPENAWMARLLGGSDAGSASEFIVHNTIRPGPLPIGPPQEGALRPALANASSTLSLRNAVGTEIAVPGVVYSQITPFGSHHRYVLDDGELTLAGVDGPLAFGGRGVDMKFSRGDEVSVVGNVDALTLTSGPDSIRIAGLDVNSTSGVSDGIAEFDASITAQELAAIAGLKNTAAAVEDLVLHSEMSADGDSGKLTFVARGNATANGQDTDFDVDLRYETTADGLRKLTALGRTLAAGEEDRPGMMRLYGEMFEVLEAGGRLKIDRLDVDTSDGPISAVADIALAPGASNPFSLLSSLNGGGTVELSPAVVQALQRDAEGAGRHIRLALQMRWLTLEDKTYRSDFTVQNGVINVNGRRLTIPLFGR